MEEKQGNIKISSENMMPIIKKWLYSDKDIFLREIVANGVDAITKFKKLAEMLSLIHISSSDISAMPHIAGVETDKQTYPCDEAVVRCV